MTATLADLNAVAPVGLVVTALDVARLDISVLEPPTGGSTPIVKLAAQLLEYFYEAILQVNAARTAAGKAPVTLVARAITGTAEAPTLQYTCSFPLAAPTMPDQVIDPT